jgi:hypothetical protein
LNPSAPPLEENLTQALDPVWVNCPVSCSVSCCFPPPLPAEFHNIAYVKELLFQVFSALDRGQRKIGFSHADLGLRNVFEHYPRWVQQGTAEWVLRGTAGWARPWYCRVAAGLPGDAIRSVEHCLR